MTSILLIANLMLATNITPNNEISIYDIPIVNDHFIESAVGYLETQKTYLTYDTIKINGEQIVGGEDTPNFYITLTTKEIFLQTYGNSDWTKNTNEIPFESNGEIGSEEKNKIILKNYGETEINEIEINNLRLVIENYNVANGDTGSNIVDSITSGLGLMGDLTNEFGKGFTTLFWDNDSAQLTAFGSFALIFMGISITFAVIKLCLALIRARTGS